MKRLITVIVAAFLAACTQTPLPEDPPQLRFTQETPFRFTVAGIRVDRNYQSPLFRPNVEHEFPTTPTQAVNIWAHDRLQALGGNGIVIISVNDASVREIIPPEETGVAGWFSGDSDARYDARLVVTFHLYDGTNALAVADASVTVTRSRTLRSSATAAEREQFYALLIHDVMQDFNAQATRQLRQYFISYLR